MRKLRLRVRSNHPQVTQLAGLNPGFGLFAKYHTTQGRKENPVW